MRRFPTMLILLFSMAVSSAAFADVRVFRSDGTRQCGMGHEISLSEGQKTLEQLGAKVLSAEKRSLPIFISAVCGAPTGRVNTYVISDDDWQKIKKGFVGPAGFGLWVFDKPTVMVFKYDGTLQCHPENEGVALDLMAGELKKAGVNVLNMKKDKDGLMHIALCGASTGSVNVFEIDSHDFEKAHKLGFEYFNERSVSEAMLDKAGAMALTATGTRPAAEGLPLPWPFPW